jgi:hypothetical protein
MIFMKLFDRTCMCILGGLLLTVAATRANADEWNKKTYVTISQSIEVPGAVLPPGKYVFKLMNSDSNRHIVAIMNDRENHVYTTNLAIPKERMQPTDKTVLTFYEMPGGAPEPIRAWFYPGDTIGQEFAYPRGRAMEIARAVKQDVPMLAESREPAAVPAAKVETETSPVEPAAPVEPTTSATTAPTSNSPTETEAVPNASSEAIEPQPAPETPAATDDAQQPATPTDGAASTPPSTPAEPTMPKTAGDTAALGLAGLSCLAVAASLRLAARRAGSRS